MQIQDDLRRDRDEISDVLIRYCRGIDRLDEALVRSCYHPDAIDNHGLYNGSVDHFVENAFTRQRTLVLACHYLHNISIELRGDIAVCETYGMAVERASSPTGELIDNTAGFRYIDRFERREGGPWLIARRTVVMDWSRSDVVSKDWLADKAFARGTRDRSDPLYQELSLLDS